ncbi:MAG: hypothetical protein LBQ73_11290 [Tannerellaceae bacterium]|jgi:hypothetical protein|nr:hypothetical protein [Tannerellaceae bacterium]
MKRIELAQILVSLAHDMMRDQKKEMNGEIFAYPRQHAELEAMEKQLWNMENMLSLMTNVETVLLPDYKTLRSAVHIPPPGYNPIDVLRGFMQFYHAYPKEGRKRGLDIELDDFKKHKDFRQVAPLLFPAIEARKEHREKQKAAGFVPNMPNMKTWIHQRRWEETLEAIPEKPNNNNITNYGNSTTTFEKL